MRVNQVYVGKVQHFAERHYEKEMSSFKSLQNVDYHLFSSEEIEQLLEENYGKETLQSYQTLLPPAYKADLARLVILDTYGGWYADLGNQVGKAHVMEELSQLDLVLFNETTEPHLRNQQGNLPSLQNGCLYSKPNSKFLQAAIDGINKNVMERYYGVSPWDITGPTHLGKIAYSPEFAGLSIGFFEGTNVAGPKEDPKWRYGYFSPNGKLAVWFKDPDKQSMFKNREIDYFQLWFNKKVYAQ